MSNGPGVIVLTDKHPNRQTKSQTDTTENNTILAVIVVVPVELRDGPIQYPSLCSHVMSRR